jgi:hypothetical protein
LGRCAACRGSLIALSRHHGRRRGFFYGCAYNSKRGPQVCSNNLHLAQAILEQAVVDTVIQSLDDRILQAAVDRALERFREEAKTYSDRRRHLDHEIRAAQAQEAHLIGAIKQGEAPAALVAALREHQERRKALETEQRRLTEAERDAAVDEHQLAADLLAAASDVRTILAERSPEARRVLQALLVERLEFSVFERDGERGYEFVGTGTYGGLLAGYTCPTTSGGPNGIRTRV